MPRKTYPIDVHVGRRIRAARLTKGYSQQQLGEALDLSFQQVQKYEKGTNRIGAGRLAKIAEALEVPLAYFFEGVQIKKIGGDQSNALENATMVLTTSAGIRIAAALVRIDRPEITQRLAELLESIAEK